MQGNPSDVIFTYLKQYMVRIGMLNVEEHGTREIELRSVRLLDETGAETSTFFTGRALTVEIGYHANRRVEKPVFGFNLKTGNGFLRFRVPIPRSPRSPLTPSRATAGCACGSSRWP